MNRVIEFVFPLRLTQQRHLFALDSSPMPTGKTTHELRLLDFVTPLGKDALLIRSINGREAISQLYSFEIEAFAGNDDPVDFSKLVGQPVMISVALKNDEYRYFHGIVKSLAGSANRCR